MLKHRIIPCVLLKDWQLVKSIQFKTFRTIGHPISTVRVYNTRQVDELIVLDIDASNQEDEINLETIKDMADECFMPLTIGGGIRSIKDIQQVLNAGADKISINTQAIKQPSFIAEAAKLYGSQCIVISIDITKVNGVYKLYNKSLGILEQDPIEWAKECEKLGAGEILLTNIDHEGMQEGYDLHITSLMSQKLGIPLIINGGCAEPKDCIEAINNGADAVAAASIFHFLQYTPKHIKDEMRKCNLAVRI